MSDADALKITLRKLSERIAQLSKAELELAGTNEALAWERDKGQIAQAQSEAAAYWAALDKIGLVHNDLQTMVMPVKIAEAIMEGTKILANPSEAIQRIEKVMDAAKEVKAAVEGPHKIGLTKTYILPFDFYRSIEALSKALKDEEVMQ